MELSLRFSGLTAICSIGLNERALSASLFAGVILVMISIAVYAFYPPLPTAAPLLDDEHDSDVV